MADEIDSAQLMDEQFRQWSLMQVKIKSSDEDDPLIIDGVRCCLDCEKPIPPARLELQPTAKRCVTCQAKKEKRYAR